MRGKAFGPSVAASVLVAGALVLCPGAAAVADEITPGAGSEEIVLTTGEPDDKTLPQATLDDSPIPDATQTDDDLLTTPVEDDTIPNEDSTEADSSLPSDDEGEKPKDPQSVTGDDPENVTEDDPVIVADDDVTDDFENGSDDDVTGEPQGDSDKDVTGDKTPEAPSTPQDDIEDFEGDAVLDDSSTPVDGDSSSVVTTEPAEQKPSQAPTSQAPALKAPSAATNAVLAEKAEETSAKEDANASDSVSAQSLEDEKDPDSKDASAKEDAEKAEKAAEPKAASKAKASNVTLYRLYNPNSGEHLYTEDAHERDVLSRLGWVYEGSAWVSPGKSEVVVYRLYNPNTGDHHYTKDKHEYDTLGKLGWKQEGRAWYGAASTETALFRLYNPNAYVGTHHYTSDANERLNMVANGWVYEGIAWYGVDMGPVAPTGAKPGWTSSGGAKFYIKSDGTAATGWQTINNKRYHFDNKGRASTGVQDVDGKIYYFASDGTTKTTWQNLSGYWYYFDPSSGALRRDGWFTQGNVTYYLDPTSGAMATGDRWIGGYLRSFTSDGVCTKTGYQVKWKNLSLSSQNVTLPSYANGSYWSYVHPTIISAGATRSECIEAFISVAYEYMSAGTRWVDNNCSRPGTTVDCSGLVMEGLYACGMDLTGAAGGDYNPYSKYYWNHSFANTWRKNQTFQPVSLSNIERGDIIYYEGHVAIYLGNGKIIESTSVASNVRVGSMYAPGTILGVARPFTK